MSVIQAVLFQNSKWTPDLAREWLRTHNLHPIKHVHRTQHFMRYRICQPNVNAEYMSKKIYPGIILVIMS